MTLITPSPAPKRRCFDAKAKLEKAIALAGETCDRSGLWLDQPQTPKCSLVVSDLLFATGILPYARSLQAGDATAILFHPSQFTYTEGANRLPLAVVVDQRTGSAAEYFAAMLQDNKAATIVGQATSGSGCGHTNGGIDTTLAHSGAQVSLPDCIRLRADGTNEVVGVTPDVLVPWRPGDSRYQRAAKLRDVLSGMTIRLPSVLVSNAHPYDRDSRARTHNLKNISVDIPQRQLTVLTGPSSSGKSSLAFNHHAEGQRRFVESMSTYVRQFLERIDRPDVDEIDGILPAISIEQKNTVKNARSTVATATELADHIRLFMTYCGETVCPDCKAVVRKETPESITTAICELLPGRRAVILAPIFFDAENRDEVLRQLIKAGYYHIWVDHEVRDLKEVDLTKSTSLELVITRTKIDPGKRTQITEAISRLRISREASTCSGSEAAGLRLRFRRNGADGVLGPAAALSFDSPLGAAELSGLHHDHRNRHGEGDSKRRCLKSCRWRRGTPGPEDCYEDLEKAAKKCKLRLDVPIANGAEWDLLHNGARSGTASRASSSGWKRKSTRFKCA
jgi:hypothetical protein